MYRYAQIANELRDRITRGDYTTGRLPAERALGQEFGVQRDTIRQALEVLTQQRILLRDSTRGTYLSPEFARGQSSPESPRGHQLSGRALLIVPAFDHTLATSLVLQGMTHRLGTANVPVVSHDSGYRESPHPDEKPYLPTQQNRREQQIRGAVLWPTLPSAPGELRALQSEMPLILIDRRVPGFDSDFIGFQDRSGGQKITEHLLNLGHRRIGFASGEPLASTVQARCAGYADALAAAGIRPDPAWELHQKGGSSLISKERFDAFLLQHGNPLTAVVCANDLVAANLIQHIHRQRRLVPEDVAITGFGDLPASMMEAFGVTTVAQSFRKLGEVAGDLLLQRWNENAAPAPFREIELPMEIIIRASCGSNPQG